jgi:hypothetical protein
MGGLMGARSLSGGQKGQVGNLARTATLGSRKGNLALRSFQDDIASSDEDDDVSVEELEPTPEAEEEERPRTAKSGMNFSGLNRSKGTKPQTRRGSGGAGDSRRNSWTADSPAFKDIPRKAGKRDTMIESFNDDESDF